MITGEGLVLRAPEESDLPRWFDQFHDPAALAYGMPSFVPIPDRPADLADRVTRAREAIGQVEPATFVIASADRPEVLVGDISWRRDLSPLLRIADIGYGVHPDARRQGVASRAIRVFTSWLTSPDGPDLARVQLDHSVENVASCRTAVAAGYEQEGVRRGFLPLRDPSAPDGVRRHDVCLHGYLPG